MNKIKYFSAQFHFQTFFSYSERSESLIMSLVDIPVGSFFEGVGTELWE